LFALAATARAQFTPGDLEVLQIGASGSGTALNSTATALFIDQFNTTTLNQSASPLYSIPTDGSGLTLSGTATSEGVLSLSTDGSILTFGGYSASVGTTGIANSSAPREVGTFNVSGQFSVVPNTSTSLGGNNIRGAVSDGHNHWIAAPSGIYYQQSGSQSLVKVTSVNTRVDNIIGGNLYYSTGSGAKGIYMLTGTPTTTATPTLLIGTGAVSGSSPYDFAINADGTIAYIADDGAAGAGLSGGIEKWTLSGGVWSLAYTIALGSGASGGARQMTVDWNGTDPIIYATTTEASANRLVGLVDSGSGSTYSVLATAPVNTVFRGVDFAPQSVPEPGTLALAGAAGLVLLGLRRGWKK